MLTSIVREPVSGHPGPAPTLVLLHGLGADEHDLMGVAPHLDERLRVVSVRAPLTSPWGGFSWFDIDFNEKGMAIDQDDIRRSFEALVEFLGTQPAPVWLGGFSQGAMMTLGVVLERPDLIKGALALSGALLPIFVPVDGALPPVFVAHGTYDPIVPVAEGRRAAVVLENMKVPTEFHEYPMEHEISVECLDALNVWLAVQMSEFTKNSP